MRRPNGHGHISKRGERFQVQVTDTDGVRHSATVATEEEAERLRLAMIRHREEGVRLGRDQQRLDDYLAAWVTDTAAGRVRPRSEWQYRCNLKRPVREMGHIPLSRLTPQHIRRCWAAMREEGYSPYTIRAAHRTLKMALKQALADGVIDRNPADSVTPPRVEQADMQALSRDELYRLFDATRDDAWGPLWVVLGTTGIRSGEARGLRWADVDLPGNRLAVRRTAVRVQGEGLQLHEPKTKASRRVIHLSALAVAALYRQRSRLDALSQRPTWVEHGLVFPARDGHIMGDQPVGEALHRALKALDLPDLRVHDLRHTAATILLHEHRVPVKVVSEMLGHTNVTITLQTYSHVMPGMHEAVAALWDEPLDGGLLTGEPTPSDGPIAAAVSAERRR